MLPCVTDPDLARLDWPAARSGGVNHHESTTAVVVTVPCHEPEP
jgi:hypothetical protein